MGDRTLAPLAPGRGQKFRREYPRTDVICERRVRLDCREHKDQAPSRVRRRLAKRVRQNCVHRIPTFLVQ